MKTKTILLILFLLPLLGRAQKTHAIIKSLDEVESRTGIHNYWLELGTNTYGYPILVPVIVMQGNQQGPTLGLTAGLHGNELNGIAIIHQLAETINIDKLNGRIIAIPGLNALSILINERRFIDEEDLNRNFPGKETGNESQQYVFKIAKRILPFFDFHIDMHTASFGRINSLYARADFKSDTLKMLAKLQQPDIILNSSSSSAGTGSATSWTMRTEATSYGIPSITVEYGNPQVFQKEMIDRGYSGVLNTLAWLKMYGKIDLSNFKDEAIYCKESYWLYVGEGGFLDVLIELNQRINKGDKIAINRNAFGAIINEYFAPEDGIVIGKSTNPANMSGGRIIHLGILI